MLETEEVDVDLFTPNASTSLATIFSKTQPEDTKENTTLKYVPPQPPNAIASEESKPQTLFATVLFGFEWCDNAWVSRGKLGLAFLKSVKGCNKIVLYDLNKIPLSYRSIDSSLKVHVTSSKKISYYDNFKKYWSLHASEEVITNILKLLQESNVTIENESNKVSKSTLPNLLKETNVETEQICSNIENLETDADPERKKNKDSILKRMANMGHSVLPSHNVFGATTSHSSNTEDAKSEMNDRNENECYDEKQSEISNNVTSNLNTIETDKKYAKEFIPCNEQVMVSNKSPITHNSGGVSKDFNDMNIFIAEQRISNSGLRFNMNVINDKLDTMHRYIRDSNFVDKSNNTSAFQNDIVQKLLNEYETKIKMYESIIKTKDSSSSTILSIKNKSEDFEVKEENISLKNKIMQLEQISQEKDGEIMMLKHKLNIVEDKLKIADTSQDEIQNKILEEVKLLKKDNEMKSEMLKDILQKMKKPSSDSTLNMELTNKVKKIMNDIFQAISQNFANNDSYTGETIKHFVGAAIKKTTVDLLQ